MNLADVEAFLANAKLLDTHEGIDVFRGEHRWLSNFAAAQVNLDGMSYPTVEHAYQAAKTLNPVERGRIRTAPTPGDAKRWGRQGTQRKDWEAVKIDVMYGLLKQKFAPGSDLGDRLLSTGSCLLVEGNTWGDTFWGVFSGRGKNVLGALLMIVRRELQKELPSIVPEDMS